jgi:hypothetical protein
MVSNSTTSEHGYKCLDSTQGREFPDKLADCMISAFRHKPHENRALLSCLSASSGNSLPT